MTYLPLSNVAKVADWARTLLTTLTQRDAAVDKQLADLKARVATLEANP